MAQYQKLDYTADKINRAIGNALMDNKHTTAETNEIIEKIEGTITDKVKIERNTPETDAIARGFTLNGEKFKIEEKVDKEIVSGDGIDVIDTYKVDEEFLYQDDSPENIQLVGNLGIANSDKSLGTEDENKAFANSIVDRNVDDDKLKKLWNYSADDFKKLGVIFSTKNIRGEIDDIRNQGIEVADDEGADDFHFKITNCEDTNVVRKLTLESRETLDWSCTLLISEHRIGIKFNNKNFGEFQEKGITRLPDFHILQLGTIHNQTIIKVDGVVKEVNGQEPAPDGSVVLTAKNINFDVGTSQKTIFEAVTDKLDKNGFTDSTNNMLFVNDKGNIAPVKLKDKVTAGSNVTIESVADGAIKISAEGGSGSPQFDEPTREKLQFAADENGIGTAQMSDSWWFSKSWDGDSGLDPDFTSSVGTSFYKFDDTKDWQDYNLKSITYDDEDPNITATLTQLYYHIEVGYFEAENCYKVIIEQDDDFRASFIYCDKNYSEQTLYEGKSSDFTNYKPLTKGLYISKDSPTLEYKAKTRNYLPISKNYRTFTVKYFGERDSRNTTYYDIYQKYEAGFDLELAVCDNSGYSVKKGVFCGTKNVREYFAFEVYSGWKYSSGTDIGDGTIERYVWDSWSYGYGHKYEYNLITKTKHDILMKYTPEVDSEEFSDGAYYSKGMIVSKYTESNPAEIQLYYCKEDYNYSGSFDDYFVEIPNNWTVTDTTVDGFYQVIGILKLNKIPKFERGENIFHHCGTKKATNGEIEEVYFSAITPVYDGEKIEISSFIMTATTGAGNILEKTIA